MKKILVFILTMLVLMAMVSLPAAALAEGDGLATVSSEFFTWDLLATEAGCMAAVWLFTQLFKGVGFISKMPTQLFSYIIAFPVLLAAAFFLGNLTWSYVGLAVFNAGVVSLSANGLHDAGKKIKQAISK